MKLNLNPNPDKIDEKVDHIWNNGFWFRGQKLTENSEKIDQNPAKSGPHLK